MADTRAIAKKNAPKYIEGRIQGMNKKEAMAYAGYKESVHKVPSLIEKSKTYMLSLEKILDTTSSLLRDAMYAVTIDEINAVPIQERIKILKAIAEINKILTPTIKIKEQEMQDGSVRTTKWQGLGE